MPVRAPGRPPIVLLTDFGYADHYAGVMKGVIAAIAPSAAVLDLTHGVPAQAVSVGALLLRQSWKYFPPKTIFAAVVDPGVGTKRRAIAVETKAGARFVGPDNGLLWPAVQEAGLVRATELSNPRYHLGRVSSTFHGRDVFAPAAAHLWCGARLGAMGPRISGIMPLTEREVIERERELMGTVVHVDGFGNLITNLERDRVERFAARFPTRQLLVRIGRSAPMEIRRAYGDASKGTALATFGSFETLEIAVREASAALRFNAGVGVSVRVAPKGSHPAIR